MVDLSKKRVAWLSVASNSLLTLGKLGIGLLSGSMSIISEAAHSAIDLVAACIATWSVHAADKPPDKNHPYGHEKIENISGVTEGLLIFAAALWIIFEAINRLIHGGELQHVGAGIIIMAVSAAVNMVVATLLRRAAVRERSVALEADAAHLFTDVYTSVGVLAGLAAIALGEALFSVQLTWLDPVIALAVALLILATAYRITRKSLLPLLDASADPQDLRRIQDILEEFKAQVVGFHNLRTRRAGGSLFVDLHMGCRAGTTLEDGHAMGHALKARIEEQVPGAKVLVHVEPSKPPQAGDG